MKSTSIAAAVAIFVPILASAPVLAAESTQAFVEKAAMSDMYEIQAGKLAASQAENGDVKSFGQEMVDDHSNTTEELSELIDDNDIDATLPTALDDKHQAKLDKLKELSGPKFDKTYISDQVTAHEKAVSMFQDYAQSGDNEKLKAWANDTLPALKEHLEEAKALDQEVSKAQTAMSDSEAANEKPSTAMQAGANNDANAKKNVKTEKIDYVTRQQPTDWTAQALIGKTVENSAGENLGEINNVVLNEKGDVVAVTIGVGGFLGIGEKDVGVPFSALDFRTEAEMDAAEADDAEDRAEAKEEQAEDRREARYDSEHADIVVVLNATREQLESAPAYVWLDDQDDDNRSVVR